VFLFHGRGGDANSVYDRLGQHILRDDIVLVAPEAYSNCWYPFRFNEPVNTNQPWIDSAVGWIDREVTSLVEKGLKHSQILFGGFSQGSCLALEYPLRFPRQYGGVFCLSGGTIGPLGERQPLDHGALENTPVFLGCADKDDWIPRPKFDESVALLEASGAAVESEIYEDLGHNICEDELNRVRAMITHVFDTSNPTESA